MSNRALPIAIIVVVIGAGLAYMLFFQPSQPEVPDDVEEPPTDETGIVFNTTDGDQVTIDGYLEDGKPLVIYFFATWCPVCRRDLENLNATYPQYEDDVNVLVVGFDPTESMDKIRDYKEGRNYEWPFAVYNRDALIEFQIVSQASKVGLSAFGEVVFSKGYSFTSLEGWVDLLEELARPGR
jgi:thiol-disulfide isomerase/thioredoxin